MKKIFSERPYFLAISLLVLAAWLISAWHPTETKNWLIENSIVLILAPFLWYFLYYIRLSNFSITLLAIFVTLHFIGAHYNYGEVAFGNWLKDLFGASKNIYDRFVHFSFGLLVVYPIRELLLRVSDIKGFFSYYLPFDVVLSFSALYEIFEWAAFARVSPEIGLLFIGGNDVMDAPKDMASAAVGALITLILLGVIQAKATKNFRDTFTRGLVLNRERILKEDSFLHRFFSK